jgi:hypothetical protein
MTDDAIASDAEIAQAVRGLKCDVTSPLRCGSLAALIYPHQNGIEARCVEHELNYNGYGRPVLRIRKPRRTADMSDVRQWAAEEFYVAICFSVIHEGILMRTSSETERCVAEGHDVRYLVDPETSE